MIQSKNPKEGSVVSNCIGMKFGTSVSSSNYESTDKDSDYWYDVILSTYVHMHSTFYSKCGTGWLVGVKRPAGHPASDVTVETGGTNLLLVVQAVCHKSTCRSFSPYHTDLTWPVNITDSSLSDSTSVFVKDLRCFRSSMILLCWPDANKSSITLDQKMYVRYAHWNQITVTSDKWFKLNLYFSLSITLLLSFMQVQALFTNYQMWQRMTNTFHITARQ